MTIDRDINPRVYVIEYLNVTGKHCHNWKVKEMFADLSSAKVALQQYKFHESMGLLINDRHYKRKYRLCFYTRDSEI